LVGRETAVEDLAPELRHEVRPRFEEPPGLVRRGQLLTVGLRRDKSRKGRDKREAAEVRQSEGGHYAKE
jgi:hypothetical protein